MFTHTSKKIFSPMSLTLALALVLCFGNSVQFLQAQPAPTPTGGPEGAASGAESQEEENIICVAEMDLFIAGEEQQFITWMNGHFNNKSSSSSLLDDAFGKYGDYRAGLYRKYAEFFPHQGALQLTEGLEPGACLKLVENALTRARRVIEQKARSTSTVKKTTALISKYQQINGELRNLNQSFVNMKKYLDTFADKLPCYVRQSCNKG